MGVFVLILTKLPEYFSIWKWSNLKKDKHNVRYYLLRFGLANAINKYLILKIRVVCGRNILSTKSALILISHVLISQRLFCSKKKWCKIFVLKFSDTQNKSEYKKYIINIFLFTLECMHRIKMETSTHSTNNNQTFRFWARPVGVRERGNCNEIWNNIKKMIITLSNLQE